MARQANILSFEDAATASAPTSRRAARPPKASRAHSRSSATAARATGSQRPARQPQTAAPRGKRAAAAASPSASRNAVAAADKRQQRRRARAKAQADRMYAKQYEGARQPTAEDEGAPRAALYEAKMGASHRKSARMQRASSASPQSAKLDPAGWFANLHVSPRALRAATALLCVVLVGVFLYTPAQQYYQAQRDRDRLAAEYAQIEQRNDTLNYQNGALSSNAGMEDAVREKYGYVVRGDETAVVTGLAEPTTDSSRDGRDIEANVLASAVKAPEEWYTPYLDAFFGVS